MDILLRQTMKKNMKYLYISTIELKKMYWRNCQHSLMICTTHILVQLKYMSW